MVIYRELKEVCPENEVIRDRIWAIKKLEGFLDIIESKYVGVEYDYLDYIIGKQI